MKFLLSILFCLLTYFSFSQMVLKGTVYFKNDSISIPGVTVKEVGTSNYTTTDFDGNFTIKTKTNKLSFEFPGTFTKEIIISKNEKIKVYLVENRKSENFFPTHRNLWFTIGLYSDIINSPYGISFGNGFEEEQHLHFEDHTHVLTYEFYFSKETKSTNKTFGGKISLTNTIGLGINLGGKSSFFDPTLEYNKKDYLKTEIENFIFSSNLFYFNDLSLTLNAKVGYQKLNNNINKGVILGINKRKYRSYNFEANIGYWKNYFSYNSSLSKFIYKKSIMLTFQYERLDNLDFFNIKTNYLFRIRKRIIRK